MFVRQKLIIFVKAPRPGFVKTRLAKAIGPDDACGAYNRLVTTLSGQLSGLNEVELRFTPDDAATEIAHWLSPTWSAAAQGEGDLGERLRRAFDQSFVAGWERVAIIGSDCPWIGERDIVDSWNLLTDHDTVLGPATDGGYWLIALKASAPDLFSNIDWSTSYVLEQTLGQIARSGRSCHLLRELGDIDTAEDWKRFLSESKRGARE